MVETKKKRHCQICDKEIDHEEYDRYNGLCQGCWSDETPEEPDNISVEFT